MRLSGFEITVFFVSLHILLKALCMLCPKCANKTKVTCTVTGAENERYRKCKHCDFCFPTVEVIKHNRLLAKLLYTTES